MFYLLKLAVRNIGRNKRRSFLAFTSVAISLMVIIFLQAWTAGVMESIIKNSTKNETGHIRIAAKKFEEKYRFYPVSDYLKNPDSLISSLMKNSSIASKVAVAAKRIDFGVILSNGSNNKAAVALAGDPETEKQLLLLQKSLLPGSRYLAGPRSLIMGNSLAKSLNYRLGDTVRVMTTGSDYALHLKKFVMVGLFKTGMNVLDDMIFQININDARNLLAMGNGAQQIVIMLNDYHDAEKVALTIRNALTDTSIAVTPWTKIGDLYRTVMTAEKVYTWIFGIVALLGAFIISNIMVMVVLERRKEIGILKSLGMTSGEVLAIFLWEGMILGLVGSLVGALCGSGIVLFFHVHGIDLSSLVRQATLPMDNIIYPATRPANLIATVVLGAGLSALMSLLPSRQAARMNVVDAIKSI
jgi:putative ABC transport system permease protein